MERSLSRSFARWDVIVVPFPFTDRPVERRRPAVIISTEAWNEHSGHVVCAMITAARRSGWPLDVAINELEEAGLTKSCVARMKLFTIDAKLIDRRVGRLSSDDQRTVGASLAALIA